MSGSIPAVYWQMEVMSRGNTAVSGSIPRNLSRDRFPLDTEFTGYSEVNVVSTRLLGSIRPSLMLTNGHPDTWNELSLTGTQLSGTIPTMVSNNTWVHIWISQTRLSGTLSDVWSGAASLRELGLIETALSGTLPQLHRMMQSFGFASTRLSGSIPASYASLTSIHDVMGFNSSLRGDLSVVADWIGMRNCILFSATLSGTIPIPATTTNVKNMLLQRNQVSGHITNVGKCLLCVS